MFDFAWSEIMLIGIVALVAIGPKDLPVAMKAVAGMVKKARRMAAEFQTHVDDMMRDADLKEVRDQINELRNFDLKGTIERAVDEDHSLRDTFASNPLEPEKKPAETPPAETEPAGTGAAIAADPAEAAAEAPGADAPAFIPPDVADRFEPQPAFIPPGTTAPGTYYSGFRA